MRSAISDQLSAAINFLLTANRRWLIAERLFYRPEPAGPDAGFTLRTEVFVDLGRLFLFPGNGITGAGLETEPAHLAFFFIYLKVNQGGAYQGPAMFILNVFLIFFTEMAGGGQHRVRGCLPEPAVGQHHDVAA